MVSNVMLECVVFCLQVKELRDSNLVVKQKSLLAARELLATPVSYMGCISAGITPAVVALLQVRHQFDMFHVLSPRLTTRVRHDLQDEDALVRERAAGTMEYIATKEVGARDIIQHVGIPALVLQLTDGEEAVRDAAYQALIEAARFDCTRRAIVQQATVLPMLMHLVLTETQARPLQGLRLLNACVQVRGCPGLTNCMQDIMHAMHAQAPGMCGLRAQHLATCSLHCVENSPRMCDVLGLHGGLHACTHSTSMHAHMHPPCMQVCVNLDALKQLLEPAWPNSPSDTCMLSLMHTPFMWPPCMHPCEFHAGAQSLSFVAVLGIFLLAVTGTVVSVLAKNRVFRDR